MSDHFVELIQAAAEVLEIFTESIPPGGREWDGTAYRPSTGSVGDAHAAKWWGVLTTLAEMMRAQTAPLSTEQKDYLQALLFGGMGSFNDFALEEDRLGPKAAPANQELEKLRQRMFEEFRRM